MSTVITTSAFLKGALTLTTALAWNTAAKETISHVYKAPGSGAKAQIAYAASLTILVIFVIFIYNRTHEVFAEKMNVGIQKIKQVTLNHVGGTQESSLTPWDRDNTHIDYINLSAK